MEKSEEYHLFIDGVYQGVKKTPTDVFESMKGTVTESTANTYVEYLAALYNSHENDDVVRAFATLGAAVVYQLNENDGKQKLIILPPYLANEQLWMSVYKDVDQDLKTKFRGKTFLLTEPIIGDIVPSAWSGKTISDILNMPPFLNTLLQGGLNRINSAWAVLVWVCLPGAFSGEGKDSKCMTENVLFDSMMKMIQRYQRPGFLGRAVVPQGRPNAAQNRRNLQSFYGQFGKAFHTLHIETIARPDAPLVHASMQNALVVNGEGSLMKLKNVDANTIIRNQRCTLNGCEPSEGPVGLYLGIAGEPVEFKNNFPPGWQDNFECDPRIALYQPENLQKLKKQLGLETVAGEGDTALCLRIKNALKTRLAHVNVNPTSS